MNTLTMKGQTALGQLTVAARVRRRAEKCAAVAAAVLSEITTSESEQPGRAPAMGSGQSDPLVL